MAAENFLFTESHEWIESAGDVRTIGITDHAQVLMGDIVFADLPKVGSTIAKGAELLVIESPKAAASVYAPVSGEIVAVNDALGATPDLINKDPYGEGWIVKIRPTDAAGDTAGLKGYDAYMESIS